MSIGTATMLADKTILLSLRAEGEDGMLGDGYFKLGPSDKLYDEVIRHVTGLRPGMTKLVEPWPEEKDFDESKHPRDEQGRWTDSGGGGDGAERDEGAQEIAITSGKSDADLPETQLLLSASEIEDGDITDVTDYPREGTAGFLTPSGRVLDVGPLSHVRAAVDAGTSFEAVLQEGTARLYATTGFLGIETAKPPTYEQVSQLIKLAKSQDFEKFVVESPGQGTSKIFDGLVTARAIRETIDEAFRPTSIHTTPGAAAESTTPEAPQPFIASTNIFTSRFVQVKDEVGFGKSDKGGARVQWTQEGKPEKIGEHASAAVVKLGGTKREYAVLVGRAHTLPSKVSMVEGGKDPVDLKTEDSMLRYSGQTFDLYHNHPYPYPLSLPDLMYLNNNRELISIQAAIVGGGQTTATIPGRGHLSSRVPKRWLDFNEAMYRFEARVMVKHTNMMTGPIAKVVSDLAVKVRKKEISLEEGNHVANFLGQYAQITALAKAKIINLDSTVSPWQQKYLDEYKPEFDKAFEIAVKEARAVKKDMALVETA